MDGRAAIARDLAGAHTGDAADVVQRMTPEAAARVLSFLGPGVASAVLVRMPTRKAASCLGALIPAEAGAVLDGLSASVGAALVRCLPRGSATAVLECTGQRSHIEEVLQYPAMSVGGIMESDVPSVPLRWTTDQAIEAVSEVGHPSCRYLYVTDPEGVLVGVLERDRIVGRGKTGVPLAREMHAPVVSLRADSPVRSVVDHPAWLEHDVLPVTGGGDLLVGILRHRQLRRYGQAARASGGGDAIGDVLLPLGELYWLQLWKLVDALVADHESSRSEREGDS